MPTHPVLMLTGFGGTSFFTPKPGTVADMRSKCRVILDFLTLPLRLDKAWCSFTFFRIFLTADTGTLRAFEITTSWQIFNLFLEVK